MKKKKPLLYRILKRLVILFYRKVEFINLDKMPNEECLYIANHVKMNGPIISEGYFPKKKKIWCIGEMMNLKEAPAYSFKDFWGDKPKILKPFYKLLSYIVAPLMTYLMKNADTIAVYKDARLMKTYRETMTYLDEGNNIIIFPEYHKEYNEIINDFLDKYIDVARLYYKKTNKDLKFVAMYYAPTIRKAIIGDFIIFNHEEDINLERIRINNFLKEEITRLAKTLPPHKVVPYKNLKKKNYKWSKHD